MFCSKCGNQINDGAVFCPFCGASQNETAEPTVSAAPTASAEPTVSTAPAAPAAPVTPVAQPTVNPQPVQGGFNLNQQQGKMSTESMLKLMAAGLVALQFLMMVLWFLPIFHLNLTREVSSIKGLPGFEFSLSDVVDMGSADTSTQGSEYMQIFTIISVALPILSMILMIVSMTKGVVNMKGPKIFGNTWVSAIWFLFWTLGHYAYYNSGDLSKATYGIVEGVSPTFAGILYILSGVATIVISVIMSKKLKKIQETTAGYAPQNFPVVNR